MMKRTHNSYNSFNIFHRSARCYHTPVKTGIIDRHHCSGECAGASKSPEPNLPNSISIKYSAMRKAKLRPDECDDQIAMKMFRITFRITVFTANIRGERQKTA
mmetsp:Transcript_47436/g.99211  ORF Transcript_47436/g.99211 Transcript_47436/m.99211 type:complete len:103 (-) Transcript_47436:76-384(-)